MWLSKLCCGGGATRCCLPIASHIFPRTLSTMNCLNQQFIRSYSLIRSTPMFRKNHIKWSFSRIKSTVALDQNQKVPHLQNAIIRRRQVALWLFTCCGMVYTAISLGGYTRLTESGLSMVTWRFALEKIPKDEEEWAAEFAKYKQFPEFQLLKKDLTLEEFKNIYFVEYFHRFWGRMTGIVFLLPAASFWLRGYFSSAMKKRVVAYGSLILAQGLLGWHMVRSGLEDRFDGQSDIPRVSQYRLTAHLALALTLYVGFLWTALDYGLYPSVTPVLTKGIKRLRVMAGSCKSLVFFTALSGALVAGLDAGLIYNSFPKMGDRWIPSEILDLSPTLKNFTENPVTVQFDHRILGITTFTVAIATWILARREKLPQRVKLAANILALFACGQVGLGISTLVENVPTHLALTHQSGSVILLSAATWLVQELSRMKFVPK